MQVTKVGALDVRRDQRRRQASFDFKRNDGNRKRFAVTSLRTVDTFTLRVARCTPATARR